MFWKITKCLKLLYRHNKLLCYLSNLTWSDWQACFVFDGPSYSDENILDLLQFNQENATLVYKITHDRFPQRLFQMHHLQSFCCVTPRGQQRS